MHRIRSIVPDDYSTVATDNGVEVSTATASSASDSLSVLAAESILEQLDRKMQSEPAIDLIGLDPARAYSNDDLDRLQDIANQCLRDSVCIASANDILRQIRMYRTTHQ